MLAAQQPGQTVTSTLEVTGFVADKRTSDNTTDVVAAVGQLFTGDFAQLVEFIQAKGFFMAGNLEHGVSGGIENRLAGFHMLFAQLIQNDRSRKSGSYRGNPAD